MILKKIRDHKKNIIFEERPWFHIPRLEKCNQTVV